MKNLSFKTILSKIFKTGLFIKNLKLLGITLVILVFSPIEIYEIARIKGWVEGAVPVEVTVSDKFHKNASKKKIGKYAYWILYKVKSDPESDLGRLYVDETTWRRLRVGQDLELFSLEGDKQLYARGGSKTSQANIIVSVTFFCVGYFLLLPILLFRFYKKGKMRSKQIKPKAYYE